MDAARTSVRLGAEKVYIAYRRSRADMPALDEEIDGAIAEGCELMELYAPDHPLKADVPNRMTHRNRYWNLPVI